VDSAGTKALREAIKHQHSCDSKWVETVPVTDKLNGETVWQGEVEVFFLIGHPTAQRAYAWSYATEGDRRKFVAVLGIGPVIDAISAVRASNAAK